MLFLLTMLYVVIIFLGVQMVSFSDWEVIDKEEKRRGTLVGKPREKILSVAEMLKIASGS
jgi:adrenodoxin-NADP+ reductase